MARAGLSREAVIAAAMRIADAEGIEALTMRRVSQELGVTPMALYRYLPDKSGLIDVVVDESLRDVPLADPTGPVIDELLGCFCGLHDLLRAHPGMARAAAERTLEGPMATRVADRVLELLRRNGADGPHAANLLVSAFNLTLGSALYRTSRSKRSAGAFSTVGEDTPAVRRVRGRLAEAGGDDETFKDALRRLISSYLDSGG